MESQPQNPEFRNMMMIDELEFNDASTLLGH